MQESGAMVEERPTASRVTQIRHGVQTARRMTLGLIDGIDYNQWFAQPIPGMNHIAWNLMHLMIAEDWGPTALGDPARPWVERYGDLVSQGPLADPSAYPPQDEILAALQSTHDRFTRRLAELADSDLDRKTTGAIAEYAPDLGSVLDSHIWHEGFHGGQIAVIRKALGLKPKFG